MKRYFFAWMIAALLLFTLFAYAEETDANDAVFSFRNGVKWGATIDYVQLSENGEVEKTSEEKYEVLWYDQVTVSRYSADLVYVFNNNALVSAYYDLGQMSSSDYDYLTAAISSKYGSPLTPDSSRQIAMMNIISPDDYEVYRLTNWELSDGTYIAICSLYEDAQDEYLLMYSNEEELLKIGGIYNTVGL